MNEVTDEQRAMLLSAARRVLGEVTGAVDAAERDLAWEQVFGSNPGALADARHVLSLSRESEENWKRLLKVLR